MTTPEVSAIRDADRVIGLLEAAEIPTPSLVINKLKPGMIKQGDMMAQGDILDLLSVTMLGLVPDDEQIIVSTNKGQPTVHDPNSWAGEAYRRITARMDGVDTPYLDVDSAPGFFSKLKNMFARPTKELGR